MTDLTDLVRRVGLHRSQVSQYADTTVRPRRPLPRLMRAPEVRAQDANPGVARQARAQLGMRRTAEADLPRTLGGAPDPLGRTPLEVARDDALELTGVPALNRSAAAFSDGRPGDGALEFGLGYLALAGMLGGMGGGRGGLPRRGAPSLPSEPVTRLPVNPSRTLGRASDGSVLPMREPEPIRNSLRGGSADLLEGARMTPRRDVPNWLASAPIAGAGITGAAALMPREAAAREDDGVSAYLRSPALRPEIRRTSERMGIEEAPSLPPQWRRDLPRLPSPPPFQPEKNEKTPWEDAIPVGPSGVVDRPPHSAMQSREGDPVRHVRFSDLTEINPGAFSDFAAWSNSLDAQNQRALPDAVVTDVEPWRAPVTTDRIVAGQPAPTGGFEPPSAPLLPPAAAPFSNEDEEWLAARERVRAQMAEERRRRWSRLPRAGRPLIAQAFEPHQPLR